MGIMGRLWKWFRAYLNCRKQSNGIDGQSAGILFCFVECSSGEYTVFYTFLIIHLSVLLLVNDTKYAKSISFFTDRDLLQANLDNIVDWNATGKLLFNHSKTMKPVLNQIFSR